MASITSFEDIEAWQCARELTRQVYRVTGSGCFSRDFGLRDQIQRASVSVMANIAEGFERDGKGEFLQFLSVAKGSAGEVRAHLYVAPDQQYIDQATFNQLSSLAVRTSKMIYGLMQYLRRSAHRGSKYRPATTPET